MQRLTALALAFVALFTLGFEWEGRLTRLRRELDSADPARRREVVQQLASYAAQEVRAPLLAALEDPDPGVRIEAADAVGRVRLREAVPRLLDWIEDPDADVRAAAARALGRIGEESTVPNLVRVLGDSSAEVRRAGVAALGAVGGDEVIVPLLGRLDDAEPRVRIDAAAQLGRLADPRAAVPLIGRARDDAPEVRVAIYAALGDLGDARAVPALIRGLGDGAPEPRLAAIAALGRLGAEDAVRPLTLALSNAADDDGRVAAAVTAALGQLPGTLARQALVDALEPARTRVMAAHAVVERVRRHSRAGQGEETRKVVEALAEALGAAHDPGHATQLARSMLEVAPMVAIAPAAPALLAALREGRGEPPVILEALGATGAPEALVPLLERLADDDIAVRGAALDALRRYFAHSQPDGRAADPLLAVVGDVTEPEREPVVRLLGEVGAARALPTLRALLTHRDAALRLAAVRAIGAIGDPEGAPALLPLLDDPDARLRYEAARALGASASPAIARQLLARLSEREPVDRHALLLTLSAALPRLDAAQALTPALAAAALEMLLAFADADDEALAARALDALTAWRPAAAAAPLTRELTRAGPERSLALVRALGEQDAPSAREALRALVTDEHVTLAMQAASILGERGTEADAAFLLARAPELPWPASAAAAFSLARLGRRGHLERDRAHPALCRLAASHDPFVRANVAIAMATIAAPACPGGASPLAWLEPEHAAVVRSAAARWAAAARDAEQIDPAAAGAALEACAARALTPDVAAVCARPDLPPLEGEADVYAYAPDGTRLWARRLIALRLADGSVWITRTDTNAHLRLHAAPRGPLALEDPAATPLEP